MPGGGDYHISLQGARRGPQGANPAVTTLLETQDFSVLEDLATQLTQPAQACVYNHLRLHLAFVGAVLGGGHLAHVERRFQALQLGGIDQPGRVTPGL